MRAAAVRRHISPENDLEELLLRVDTPSRYLGGEYGRTVKGDDSLFTVALCFPDLYEIGMSNTAIKILYTLMNSLPGVRCERVFAPAGDFEEGLRERKVPLYTLESGIPLCECDMIAVSVGYELSATNILAVLESGQVPIDRRERTDAHPLVIGGGPALTNPAPYADFFDAIVVGEAEECLPPLLEALSQLHRDNVPRASLIAAVESQESVWTAEKGGRVYRAIWNKFGQEPFLIDFPLPHLRPVQDHGVIEIMRGCPNGCRFCHAGIYYRPYRMKDIDAIIRESDRLVYGYGYQDISLSSLSSGDYAEIAGLMKLLHERYHGMNVSFALPSLKVDSFTLPIIEQLSTVRRSGLTFAVETPWDEAQLSLNKRVSIDQIIEILKVAKERGFRSAKLYFMLGLPVGRVEPEAEVEGIVSFVRTVFGATGIHLKVNLGTFVPKPHTPYQWARQISEADALGRLQAIRNSLRPYGFVKVGWASPFHSIIEGLISRGDERVGKLILDAYRSGARFDSWEDRWRRDAWREAFERADWEVEKELNRERTTDEVLPWRGISLGVPDAVLRRELDRSVNAELSVICAPECVEPCGVCNRLTMPRVPSHPLESFSSRAKNQTPRTGAIRVGEPGEYRLYFEYRKEGPARFLPHRSVVTAIERAMQIAGIPVKFSKGYVPKLSMELSPPLPLGAAGVAEIGRVSVTNKIHAKSVGRVLSRLLPEGLTVTRVRAMPDRDGGRRRPTIGRQIWGGRYELLLPHELSGEVIAALTGSPGGGFTLESTSVDRSGGMVRAVVLHREESGAPGIAAIIRRVTGCTVALSGIRMVRMEILARGAGGDGVPFLDSI